LSGGDFDDIVETMQYSKLCIDMKLEIFEAAVT
jgi:hypothetical protein